MDTQLRSYFIQIFVAFTGTMAFSVLFSVAKRHYIQCGIVGAVGWAVYLFIQVQTGSAMGAIFASATVLTILSRFLSVRLKTPTLVFLLTGIFTLVPGSGIFYTAYYLFFKDSHMALSYGFSTLQSAIAIALGIGVGYSIPAKLYGWKQAAEVWNEDAHRNA